jgi:hypothetical protein
MGSNFLYKGALCQKNILLITFMPNLKVVICEEKTLTTIFSRLVIFSACWWKETTTCTRIDNLLHPFLTYGFHCVCIDSLQ